jgi:hypothetical protein
MKRKLSTETPVCPQECLVIISYTTGLSFALERIGPLAAITIIVSYLLVLYLLALPNTPKNPFASIYSESLIKTTCQHLLLLIKFDTLIYWKYYDTPPLLVGHQWLIELGREILQVVLGDHVRHYARIRDYLQTLLDTNPDSRCIGTTMVVQKHPSCNPRFYATFICLNGSKEGFLNGCRPFIGKFLTYDCLLYMIFHGTYLYIQ